mmetsp:Transcript_102988/g.291725  ORF Transcript_102988/g.291725 Transcript_102988/m.291725 type:complete len:351 (+) Transcript_102988:98-1150(+)
MSDVAPEQDKRAPERPEEAIAALGTVAAQTGVVSLLGALAGWRWVGKLPVALTLAAYFAVTGQDDVWRRGGRPSAASRASAWWRWQARYYGARLVRTAKLPPTVADGAAKPYIFGVHPHGILAVSTWLNFCTDGTGFSAAFPGIDVRTAIVDFPFRIPLMRELTLGGGGISPAPGSVTAALRQGSSVALVVGGPLESMLPPGKMRLVLEDRIGFVRMALSCGASLVPCLGYGEHQLFEQAEGPLIRRLQFLSRKFLGFAPVVFYGRGGLPVPRRGPLTLVTGPPIDVAARDRASDPEGFEAAARGLLEKYVAAVRELHAATHGLYGGPGEHELEVLSARGAQAALVRSRL